MPAKKPAVPKKTVKPRKLATGGKAGALNQQKAQIRQVLSATAAKTIAKGPKP